jgi:hypothetical protein
LAGRLRQHIDSAYGGNQRAFDAVGLSPQHVYAILAGNLARRIGGRRETAGRWANARLGAYSRATRGGLLVTNSGTLWRTSPTTGASGSSPV